MEWPNNTCFRLLKEYEMHPMLWDPKNPSYFNRDIKVDAWSEIASNMNKEISDVRAKLNSLLGSFRREKAKVNKSLEEGGCVRKKLQLISLKKKKQINKQFSSFRYTLYIAMVCFQPNAVPIGQKQTRRCKFLMIWVLAN